jgi:hypothetical protein
MVVYQPGLVLWLTLWASPCLSSFLQNYTEHSTYFAGGPTLTAAEDKGKNDISSGFNTSKFQITAQY